MLCCRLGGTREAGVFLDPIPTTRHEGESEERGGEREFSFSIHITVHPCLVFYGGWQRAILSQQLKLTVARKHKQFNNDINFYFKTYYTIE